MRTSNRVQAAFSASLGHSEESAVQQEGFTRTAPPRYEEGFPRRFVERPTSQGGWKAWGLREVTLVSPQEAKFHAVVKAGDSIENPDNNPHRARGVSLSDLITERKELLKASIDQQRLEAASASTESSTPPPDADARGDQQPPAEEAV